MTTVTACDACLRRTHLVAAVAGRIDVHWRRREGAPARVLALADEALIALDPTGRAERQWARFDPAAARERCRARGLAAVCRCDRAYPDRLRALPDPPAVLHVAGRPAALDALPAAAVVGARRSSAYGREVARALGRELAASAVPVVSGLALGVDAAAHVGALEAPGGAPPVAVLAGGVDVPYPAAHARLYARVVAAGCVVAELPPGFTARRWCFVARNRVIAGLSEATVVVEAAERSGSLTTAGFAEGLGRTVAAVPGPVTSPLSRGTNGLLAAGAALVADARDVLDVLFGVGQHPVVAPAADPPLEGHLRGLLAAIEDGRATLPALARSAEEAERVLEGLTELELRGLVRREFGGTYVRVA